MKLCTRALVLGMAVTVVVLSAGHAQNVATLGKEVLELAGQSEAGKDVADKAQTLTKRFRTVGAAMQVYNPRNRAGIGYGPRGIGLEHRLGHIGERGLSAEVLKQESADLTRLAHINLVMAEVMRGYAPEKPFLGRGKKEWLRDLDVVKEQSHTLLKAVKAGDPKAVQSAAARIYDACNSCHDGKK